MIATLISSVTSSSSTNSNQGKMYRCWASNFSQATRPLNPNQLTWIMRSLVLETISSSNSPKNNKSKSNSKSFRLLHKRLLRLQVLKRVFPLLLPCSLPRLMTTLVMLTISSLLKINTGSIIMFLFLKSKLQPSFLHPKAKTKAIRSNKNSSQTN